MRSLEVAEGAEALSLVYRGLFLSNEGWGGGWGGGGVREKRKRAGNDGKRKEKHATATRQGGGPQVGEVIRFGWVTRLLISSLIFITFT